MNKLLNTTQMPEGLEFWTATEVAECLIDDRDLRMKLLRYGDHTPHSWWWKLNPREANIIIEGWHESDSGES